VFSIILYQPEIPPNTGNIIRLCANTGCHLHLIEPIAFSLDEKSLKRAGLDYHDLAQVSIYPSLPACLSENAFHQVYALSSKGKRRYTSVAFNPKDAFLFGPETRGLPKEVLFDFAQENILVLPQKTTTRSLNLSNTVAVMVYEAWRQNTFMGSGDPINT